MSNTVMDTKELLEILGVDTDAHIIQSATVEVGERLNEPVKLHLTILPRSNISSNIKDTHHGKS